MSTSRTHAQLRADIRACGSEPHGPERVARAADLVAEAEALVAEDEARAAEGEVSAAGTREARAALGAALVHLAASRAFGSAGRTTAAPVARALRLRDEDPEAFDDETAFALLWSLRWAVEDLIADPATPVADVEEWLALMARAHTEAGLSQRAVHAREFLAAQRFGDRQRAARAYDAWLEAERDRGADCAGCELAWRGRAHAARAEEAEVRAPGSGAAEDEAALRMWEPVLRGEYPCAEQQPYLLAASPAPLLRLGRTTEARSRHLAGQLLVREDPTGRGALARHVEFCALTGNEPRGLEILAEQDETRWEWQDDAPGHQAWMCAVALLMRRLDEQGQGALPVPGPRGRAWNAASLLEYAAAQAQDVADRFDRRAGTTVHGAAVRARLAAPQLVPFLPLGLGAVVLPQAGPVAGTTEAADPYRLLDEARRLSAEGHPDAAARWAAAEDAVARAGLRLPQRERAELLDHRAMEQVRTAPGAAAARFTEAASLFAGAGLPGEALACRARAVFSASFAPEGDAVPPEPVDALCAEALRLHADGRVGTRHATAVLLTRARMRAHHLGGTRDGEAGGEGTPFDAGYPARATVTGTEHTDGAADRPGPAAHPLGPAADPLGPAADALDAELADLVVLALPDSSEPAVRARIAEATETRGRLAARRGDAVRASELLAEAAGLFHEAGRPWSATGPELALARLLSETGDHKRAAEVLRGALYDRRGATRTPADLARLHLAHADVHAAQGLLAEEAESLRYAVHALQSSGGDAEATRARLRLGGCLLALEQPDEAAAFLVAALGELLEEPEPADEPGIVQSCVWLGQSCARPAQLSAAAGLFRRAAEPPRPWRDRHGCAVVTHLAADTHRASGRYAVAAELYAGAEGLWREVGDPHAVIRTLHARGWLAMESGAPVEESLRFMDAAQREIAQVLGDPEGVLDEEQRLRLRLETGHTYRQTAELLVEPVAVPPAAAPGEPGAVRGAAALDRLARGIEYADRAVSAFHACGEAGLHEATSAQLRAAGLEVELGRYDQAVDRLTRVRAAYPAGTPDPYGAVAERVSEAEALELRIESALS
ncbi:hypothetical protein [Streptomyces spirodelae]|uniref:Tetratricopeptide repeat protein n=1 Tax=Streptomyces spirodelae TaxID=2812904 RepID=A0ABS3WZL8_9ACTN|nr:hypothetical protein [Streptomyces spirodelae]MBO8188591.1 hypothetical protein [Streptomyces spirodelae]